MTSDQHFRASAGLLVVNDDGQVLALERSDRPGSWQAPQGGISVGEEPLAAAARELQEETGLRWSDVDLLEEMPIWLAYELPVEARTEKTGRGQVQQWYLVRYAGSNDAIALSGDDEETEFAAFEWIPMPELISRTWHVRRPVYNQLALHWTGYLNR